MLQDTEMEKQHSLNRVMSATNTAIGRKNKLKPFGFITSKGLGQDHNYSQNQKN